MGDVALVSDKVIERTQERRHGQVCFCELCVPVWDALNGANPPLAAPKNGGDGDDEPISISLTEWAEKAAGSLIQRSA
jgi:hypothetical protein